ncbi:MAG: hypothetical protein ABSA93_00860 [Streptosporangiaceae bacterium]|jgi:hypothetical protein
MNTERFEDRLLAEILDRHSAVTAVTEPVFVAGPPRRRRVLVGAGALLVAGTAAGVGLGVLSAPPRVASTSGTVLDAKVVANRTIGALDNLGASIEYSRQQYLGGWSIDGTQYRSSATWQYGDRIRTVYYLGTFSSPGLDWSTIMDSAPVMPHKDRKAKKPYVQTGIEVDYTHHVWFPLDSSTVFGDSSAVSFADQVRQELQAGELTVVGKVTLNGQQTIKLTGTLPAKGGSMSVVTWIDPATYLPVQQEARQILTDYEWLPPVQANLSQLTPPVPSGFTRLSGPPAYDR